MIFRRVVEIKGARAGVGATTEIAQIRFGEEESNLAGENGAGEDIPLQLGG